MDDLLPEEKLKDVKLAFRKRNHVRHPVDMQPSDTLVSRCSREVGRRLLTVYNIWGVKTLLHQVSRNRKRKKMGSTDP